MTYPDRENTLALLGEWKHHHNTLDKLMDGIQATIGLDPNAPMFNAMWGVFDAYTSTLSVEVGDFDGWLEWFYAENEMGASGGQAGYDGKTRKIKTLANLFWLIEESRKRGVQS